MWAYRPDVVVRVAALLLDPPNAKPNVRRGLRPTGKLRAREDGADGGGLVEPLWDQPTVFPCQRSFTIIVIWSMRVSKPSLLQRGLRAGFQVSELPPGRFGRGDMGENGGKWEGKREKGKEKGKKGNGKGKGKPWRGPTAGASAWPRPARSAA